MGGAALGSRDVRLGRSRLCELEARRDELPREILRPAPCDTRVGSRGQRFRVRSAGSGGSSCGRWASYVDSIELVLAAPAALGICDRVVKALVLVLHHLELLLELRLCRIHIVQLRLETQARELVLHRLHLQLGDARLRIGRRLMLALLSVLVVLLALSGNPHQPVRQEGGHRPPRAVLCGRQ